jgi:hypothetical protein
MDPIEYIESVKRFLLTDSRIVGHRILKEYANLRKCYIRARLTLSECPVPHSQRQDGRSDARQTHQYFCGAG